jgi:hypothetical protein
LGGKEKDGEGMKDKDLFFCPWWPWLEKKKQPTRGHYRSFKDWKKEECRS